MIDTANIDEKKVLHVTAHVVLIGLVGTVLLF